MNTFRRSLLSRSTLLAISTGAISASSLAATPWSETAGAVLDVTSSYSSNVAKDYPLYAEGANSVLQTTSPFLNFVSTGNNLFTAYAKNGGSINVNQGILSSNGNLAHTVNLVGGNLNMTGGVINAAGTNSYGVNGSNEAQASIKDLTINASGGGGGGVTLSAGKLVASNVNIVASGAGSQGISLAYSTFGTANAELDNVDIKLLGAGTKAGIMLGNGTVTGQKVTITSSDDNRGIDVYNAGGANIGTLMLTDSKITSEHGDAVYILGGNVTLKNTEIETNDGQGVNVNRYSTFNMDGGSISSTGDYADGIWVGGEDAVVNVDKTTITTKGVNAHAVDAQFGTTNLKDLSLTSTGKYSSGIYSSSQVNGENLIINTEGVNAHGINASLGGVVDIKNVELSTKGANAVGLLSNAGSTIKADNLQLMTSSNDAHALWVRSGTANISNSTLTTTGTNSWGIVATAASAGAGSSISMDNVRLDAQKSTAIETLGAPLDLNLQNGTQVTGGNGILLDSLAGNTTDPLYSGNVSLKATGDVVLTGDIRTSTANLVDVALAKNSSLTGKISAIRSLSLDSSSLWNMTGDSSFGNLSQDGIVNFTHTGSAFSTLTLDNLSGKGGFNMNTDLASMVGDLIVVKGDTSGSHALDIVNSGREPVQDNRALTVVATQGGDAQFTLNGGAVDAGTYEYGLEHRGNDWVLAQKQSIPPSPDPNPAPKPDPTPKPEPKPVSNPILTPTAKSALNMFNALPAAWYGELSTLRQRMGEVREGYGSGGAWIRLIGNESHVQPRDDSTYKQTQSGFTVGIDSPHELENGQNLTGLLMGYSQSKMDLDNNSNGTINSFFVGGYSTWLLQDGWYIDTVAKANNFSSHAEVRMSNGVRTKGGFNTPGFGLSLEGGRQIKLDDGWFVEPSLQLSALWIDAAAYDYSNGLHTESKSSSAQQAGMNGVLGRTLELDNGMKLQPWIRAAVIQEFSDHNTVRINGNHFNNDMSGTRTEYGAGLSAQITPFVQIYADASYSYSDKSESPLRGSLGSRWTF